MGVSGCILEVSMSNVGISTLFPPSGNPAENCACSCSDSRRHSGLVVDYDLVVWVVRSNRASRYHADQGSDTRTGSRATARLHDLAT